MPVTVGVNMLAVVHSSSAHLLLTFPDACQTPSPVGPVPIPYPNIAMSSNTMMPSMTVMCDGVGVCLSDSFFLPSTGDEPGALGGVKSGMIKGKAEFISYSFDVKFEGKNVARSFDLMTSNAQNTPPVPLLGIPIIAP